MNNAQRVEAERLASYKAASRAMWEEGAKAGGRNPKMEVRAFDSGWDSAMAAISNKPRSRRSQER